MTRDPRPRDRLGRPLRHDSGVAVEPDPQPLPPVPSLEVAQSLLDDGRAFRAHEVLETAWKAAPAEERDLWRGLAQLAVGVTHAQRGNRHGAVSLLRRAAATLRPWERTAPYDVDVAGLRAWALRSADAVEADGVGIVADVPPPRLVRGSGG